jgi:pyridinium-3,5-bisthiocarboxylic acid mononucleotide nickel chelatase
MKIQRIGCGAGQRDWPQQPNILRLLVGETIQPAELEQVLLLETNLDDISGELIGYCTTRLLEAGALDVYTTAIQMKKNRPAVKLSVLCQADDAGRMEAILFAETTTLGVRRWPVGRHVLKRCSHQVQTPWGPIDGKVGWLADGPPRFAPEFESCRQLALRVNLPLRAVYDAAQKAFDPKQIER